MKGTSSRSLDGHFLEDPKKVNTEALKRFLKEGLKRHLIKVIYIECTSSRSPEGNSLKRTEGQDIPIIVGGAKPTPNIFLI